MYRYRLADHRGFSTVELSVAVAIIALMVAIGIPTFYGYLPHLRLKNAARDIVSNMQLARIKAIAKNRQYRVRFTVATPLGAAGGSFQLQEGNAASGSTTYTTIDTVNFTDADRGYPGISLYSATNNPIFSPTGSVANLTTVELRNAKGGRYQITTSIAGRVKMTKVA